MKYNYNDKGEYIGSTDVQLEGFKASDTEPKGLVNPLWDGKGWTEAKAGAPYANFADYGFASALEFATDTARVAISGGRVVLSSGVDTAQLEATVGQLITFAKGGTADAKVLDAFVAANAGRSTGLDTLASLQTTLDAKPKMAGVVAIIKAVRDLPALNS